MWGVGVGWEGGREAGGRCVLRFFVDCVGGQKQFFVLCAFLWARKGRDLLWGGWGGHLYSPPLMIYCLLVLLQVFVGIVEEFEEIRGFSRSESSCSGVVLVWVILAR